MIEEDYHIREISTNRGRNLRFHYPIDDPDGKYSSGIIEQMALKNTSNVPDVAKMTDFQLGMTYNTIMDEMKKRGLMVNKEEEEDPPKKKVRLDPPIQNNTLLSNNNSNNNNSTINKAPNYFIPNTWLFNTQDFLKSVTSEQSIMLVRTSIRILIARLPGLLYNNHTCRISVNASIAPFDKMESMSDYFIVIMCKKCIDSFIEKKEIQKYEVTLRFTPEILTTFTEPLTLERKDNNTPIKPVTVIRIDKDKAGTKIGPTWKEWKQWGGWTEDPEKFLKNIANNSAIIGIKTRNRIRVAQLNNILQNDHICTKHINAQTPTVIPDKDLHMFFCVIMCRECMIKFITNECTTRDDSIIDYFVTIKAYD